jgi:sugar phosphate isomerase/epimerase
MKKDFRDSYRTLTRREFSKCLVGFLSATHCFADAKSGPEKPNSKVAGVQIGLNVPYSFGAPKMSGEEILRNCVSLGLSAVELRTQPVEAFLGLPKELSDAPKDATSARAKLMDWRKSAPIDKAKAFRDKYEAAGVRIEIVKVDGIFQMSDAELDYVFSLARTLGGRAISTEISRKTEELQHVGNFADKHRLMVGYHGHASTTPEHWEHAFSLAKYNGANVDLGHFVAGNNVSPAEFIKKHHGRVTHVHVKDRKRYNGPNMPFGEGDTPIREVLQLIRDNKWDIQATIEFEYKIPPDSDRMTEIGRAIRFCREALA